MSQNWPYPGLPSSAPAPRWSWQQRTGLVLMGLLALWALLGPWLVDASPIEQNLRNQLAHPGAAHWLGTDVLGRSWLARLAHATQLSLGMAVLAALSAAVPGTNGSFSFIAFFIPRMTMKA